MLSLSRGRTKIDAAYKRIVGSIGEYHTGKQPYTFLRFISSVDVYIQQCVFVQLLYAIIIIINIYHSHLYHQWRREGGRGGLPWAAIRRGRLKLA